MSNPTKLNDDDRLTLELAGQPGFPIVPTDEIRVALARLDYLEAHTERVEKLLAAANAQADLWAARCHGADDAHRRAEAENDKLRAALLAAAALLDRWRGFDFDCPDEEYDDDSDTYDEDGTALAKLYEDTSTFRASPPFGEPGIVT